VGHRFSFVKVRVPHFSPPLREVGLFTNALAQPAPQSRQVWAGMEPEQWGVEQLSV